MASRRHKKKKKVLPLSRGLFVFQSVALAATVWLLCSQWAPLAAGETPAKLIGGALLYLFIAWACAFGMTLWTYLALSLDPSSDLVLAAGRTSVHALWFVPGMMLALAPAPWTVTAAGFLMMVNGARLVVASPPPQKRALSRRKLRMSHRLFGESRVNMGFFTKETSPAILGAFAIQAGSFAVWAGYRQWAAPLFAGGVASLTWSSLRRGAFVPRKRRNALHNVLSVAMAVVLTLSLSVIRLGADTPAGTGSAGRTASTAEDEAIAAGWLERTRREVQDLLYPPKAKAAPPKPKQYTRLAAPMVDTATLGTGGIPGLILYPGKKKAQSVTIPLAYRIQVTLSPSKPVSIPFTGEYHLFRESSVKLPPGAEVRDGSPMDAVYVTTNGGPMETDAYQEFDPPVDFSTCGRIRLTLTSGEIFPASATLILVGAESVGEIGPEIFGMSADPEETLEFTIPKAPDTKVTGLRVIFRHNPMEASHSTQVAIQRLTFLPRGL